MKVFLRAFTCLLCVFLIVCLVIPARVDAQQKREDKQEKIYEVKKKEVAEKRQWHVSAGFRLGCLWWQPVWQKYLANEIGNGLKDFEYTIKPAAIFGPMLGFTFNPRWSIAWNFQYGRYLADARALVYFPSFIPLLVPNTIHLAVDKIDSDLIAVATLAKYVRLFFGPRYQGYRYKEKFLMITSSPVVYHSIAMGVGCLFTVPIGANFYFLPSIAMVGLVGWEEPNPLKISYTLQSEALLTGAVGVNTQIDIGYHIPSIGIMINGGLRVQYLHYLQKARPSYGRNGDLFLGPTIAVTYTY